MTPMLKAVQFTVALLASGCVIYHFANKWCRRRIQAEYEKAFLERHRTSINIQQEYPHLDEFIPLTLPYHHKGDLLNKFCKQYLRTEKKDYWSPESEEYEVHPEVLSMRFRRLAEFSGTIRVQAIRCESKYGLIGTGDRQMGYILIENDFSPGIFNIFEKFQYEQTSLEDIEAIPRTIKKD